jgi:hypothetical protein
MAVKVAYTAFVAILVPYYWMTYSPWNFLFFCDLALLLTLPALWLESPLLMSLPAVGIILPQVLWVADFLSGARIVGMTSYMFDPGQPLFARGLSGFHGWLPFLLAWAVWRLGYDRRALPIWTAIATAVLLVSFFLAPAPPAPVDRPNLAVNLNYVHGLSYEKPQTWMAPGLWLTLLLVGTPALLFLPAHLVLSRWCPAPIAGAGRAGQPLPTESPAPAPTSS